MGGSVALTIRDPEGKEHRMCRWTNVTPSLINNLRLLNKDPAYVKEAVKIWYEMRQDYEAHKSDGNFEHNMSECYGPYPFLAPHGYGLIVVDMVNDQILDYQGYTGAGEIASVKIRLALTEDASGGHTLTFGGRRPEQVGMSAFDSEDESTDAMRFRRLYEAGRITQVIDVRREGNGVKREVIELKGKSLDDIVEMIKSRPDCYFPIDTSPFQLTRYWPHDSGDARTMQARIEELGFQLSNEEKELWDEWASEHED